MLSQSEAGLLGLMELSGYFRVSFSELLDWLKEGELRQPDAFDLEGYPVWCPPISSVAAIPFDDPTYIADLQCRIEAAELYQGVDF